MTTKRKKKPRSTPVPPIGLHIQGEDGAYVRAPDGIVDQKMTIRELAAKAFEGGFELHFQLVGKPPEGEPRDTRSTMPKTKVSKAAWGR